MSKTRRHNKRFYDPEDFAWDHGDDDRKSDKMKQRRDQKRIKNALKTKDLDALIIDE